MKRLSILALVFGPCLVAIAGTVPQHSFTIVVGDHVGIAGSAVRKAAHMAERILRQAGVSTAWLTCAPAESGKSSHYQCLSGIERPDLVVRILPKPMRGYPVARETMGTAAAKSGQLGSYAYIYYDRVQQAAQVIHCDTFRILGHAIAHEISHLLGDEHSKSGLMRVDWNNAMLANMSRGYVFLSLDDARRMRVKIAARILEQRTSR